MAYLIMYLNWKQKLLLLNEHIKLNRVCACAGYVTCIQYFSHHCDKIPHRSNMRKGGSVLGHHPGIERVTLGRSWQSSWPRVAAMSHTSADQETQLGPGQEQCIQGPPLLTYFCHWGSTLKALITSPNWALFRAQEFVGEGVFTLKP